MAEIITQGWIIPAILGLMGLEWVILALWYLRHKAGPDPLGIAANLIAGGGLLLAMRAGIADQTAMAAIWLALAGLGHVGDLMIRFGYRR